MHALSAYIACMKPNQYTIRGIPEKLDDQVREEAQKYHRSMNTLLLEALSRGLGRADEPVLQHDLDDIAGTWIEDPAFDDAIAAFDKIDDEVWK